MAQELDRAMETEEVFVPSPFAPGVKPPEGMEHLVNKEKAPVADPVADPAQEGEFGKYDSLEALLKGHKELETKLGTPKEADPKAEEKPDTKPEQTPEQIKHTADLAEAQAALTARGLSMTDFTAEMEKDGKLSDASYAKLKEAGYPAFMVDQYIKGAQAPAEDVKAVAAANAATQAAELVEIKAIAGGDAGFDEIAKWAVTNLPEGEVAAFNKAVDAEDVNTAKIAVRGLKATFDAANGVEGRLLQGGAKDTAGAGYASQAEQLAAMNDPKYRVDPVYTHEVERKSIASTF